MYLYMSVVSTRRPVRSSSFTGPTTRHDRGVPSCCGAFNSCPSHFHESGLFFEFGAVRTDLTEMLRAGGPQGRRV